MSPDERNDLLRVVVEIVQRLKRETIVVLRTSASIHPYTHELSWSAWFTTSAEYHWLVRSAHAATSDAAMDTLFGTVLKQASDEIAEHVASDAALSSLCDSLRRKLPQSALPQETP